eukprot:TRINITY_DN1010_c0_g1_i4.p1 TRINITY_DN1010_c0_g1~~TRINITY_DN1010_c0_g1_i4.p1  ORF type:complete len:179 (+),score=37.42 TRINITY_DN1010_c0_g1_i4:146-682(+)
MMYKHMIRLGVSFRAVSYTPTRGLSNYSFEGGDYTRQYLSKRIFIKPYSIFSEDMVLSVTPIKGKYAQKKDYITLNKNGCVLLEMIPQFKDSEQKTNLNWQNKKSFALNLKAIGDILEISERVLSEGRVNKSIKYSIGSTKEVKELLITRDREDAPVNMTIRVSHPDIYLLFSSKCNI